MIGCLIIVIAFLYASVGHGGASGYLAIMTLVNIDIDMMKASALVLNILVSSIAFMTFYRKNHFKLDLFLPFAAGSVPAAFIGGLISVDIYVYKIILAICLFISIFKLSGVFDRNSKEQTSNAKPSLINAVACGAIIGFISGLIGIGGGILLSPLILLMRWGTIKETSAVSSLFILLNSVAALMGYIQKDIVIYNGIWQWALLASIGGFIGSWWATRHARSIVLKYILSIVLLIACIKLMPISFL